MCKAPRDTRCTISEPSFNDFRSKVQCTGDNLFTTEVGNPFEVQWPNKILLSGLSPPSLWKQLIALSFSF